MKSPIGPLIMRKMPVNDYVKKNLAYLKKAAQKGIKEVPCLVIESHDYLCGKNHAFTYYGAQSQVMKLFKILQKEQKKNPALSFAKGTCRISMNEQKILELDYALKGSFKPEAVKKNSRKLFTKMGVTLLGVKKGEFEKIKEEKGEKEQDGLSMQVEEQQEVNSNDSIGKESSSKSTIDDQTILATAKAFQNVNATMKKDVLPLLQSKEEVTYTQTDIDIAESAYKSMVDFINQCELRKKEGIAYEKPSVTKLQNMIVSKNLKKKYLGIWKKVKVEHEKEMNTLDETDQAKLRRVEELLKEIKQLETQQSLA